MKPMYKTEAAVLYQMELPSPYSHSQPLKIEELELSEPGPGEVLVEVAHAGLCHSDLSVIDGVRPRVMPMVLGHEASGIVRETGPGVAEVAEGDHVVFSYMPACGRCRYCQESRPVLCEHGAKANATGTLLNGKRQFRNRDGQELNHHLGISAFSRYTVVAQESLVRIDQSVPLQIAALFGCAVVTGVGAVFNTAQVKPGDSVAVFGTGGIGLSTLMGARAAGAYPIIAVGRQLGRLEKAMKAGATHTVNYATSDPVEVIKGITGGGADFSFETVGDEKVLSQAYRAARRGGTAVTAGLPHPERQLTIPAVSLVAEEKTIKGSYMGSAVPRRDIPRYIQMYQGGLLPVELLHTHTIGLKDINRAFDALAAGKAVRQIIGFGH
jgi:alcohol dehydrogenase